MLDLSKQASWLGLFLTQMSHVAVQATVPNVPHGVNHLNVPPVEWVNSDISSNYVGKDSNNDVDDVKVDFTQITHKKAAWKFDCGTVATPLYYGHTLQHRKHINFTAGHNAVEDQDEKLHPKISFSANAEIKKINVHMHDLYLEARTTDNPTAAHHGYQDYRHKGSRLSHQPINYWKATYDVADGATTIANDEAASVEEAQKYIKVCPMRNTTHTYQIDVKALDKNSAEIWSKQVQVQYTRPLTHGERPLTHSNGNAASIILHNRQQIHHHQQIKAKKMIQTDNQQTLVM